jgi:hypothetical protein
MTLQNLSIDPQKPTPDEVGIGPGTYASRSMMVGGSALRTPSYDLRSPGFIAQRGGSAY